jgi:AraC family transcriptional regulator, arabinose operon regulatory protein
MSIIDRTRWQNPFTEQGLRLPADRGARGFQIHETGVLRLNGNWQHRSVCSPFWRLFYEFSSGTWVECAGERVELNQERVVLLPAGVPFDCGSQDGVDHLWLHFTLQLNRPFDARKMLMVSAGPDFSGVAVALHTAVTDRQLEKSAHLATALLHVTLSNLGAGWTVTPSRRLHKVLTWLGLNLGAQITNEVLANQAGMGVEGFIRWFKAQTGQTPAAYVAEHRVQEACRRLALTDESIEQIADHMGFSNRHHFSRVFAKYAGCGPATFRKGDRRGE